MQILDNVLILALPILAFIAGLKLAGHYYSRILAEYQYAEKILSAGKGLGYIALPQLKKSGPIGQDFMDRLHNSGHATQAIRNPRR